MRTRIKQDEATRRLTAFLTEQKIPILLFAIGLALRISAAWIHVRYGTPVQSIGTLVPFADFDAYVQPQLAYLAQGLLPYRDFAYSIAPFFLYGLYPFYAVGGSAAAAFPIYVTDAFVPVLIYLIAKSSGARAIGIFAGIGYALSPLPIFYEGLLWMNSEPALLLALASLYLIQQERLSMSAIVLGTAALFNQATLSLLPVLVLWHLKNQRVSLPRSSLLFLGTLLLGSLPFLLLTPIPYLRSTSYGILGGLTPEPGFRYVSGIIPITNATEISSLVKIQSLEASGTCTGIINLFTNVETCAANGTIFYSVNHPQGLLGALSLFSNKVGALIIGALSILLLPAIWVVRKAPNFYLLASVYSSLVFLVMFAFEVHTVIRYYLLLPYALLLASSFNRRTIVIPVIAMVVGMFTPEGNFQLILLLSAFLAFISLTDICGIETQASGGQNLDRTRGGTQGGSKG